VTALAYVIGVLDGFRRPPFPFSKVYKAVGKNRQTWVPRPAQLDASFLNYYLTDLGQNDAKVSETWRTLRREIEAFQRKHDEFNRARRRLLVEFASGFIFAIFVLKLVSDALSLPNWTIAVFLVLLIYPLSKGFSLTERRYADELRAEWKDGNTARNLIGYLGHHLLMAAHKEGRNPSTIRIKLAFDDYDNLHSVGRHGRLYIMSPAPPSSN
jgi:hypothetical protein